MKLNILIIVIISLILGFRPPFGTDYYSYQSIWYGISSNFLTVEYAYLEPGFILIIKIIKQFLVTIRFFYNFFVLNFFPLIFIKKT